jgi:hypothetical protein
MSIGTGSTLFGVGETYRFRFSTYNSSGALTNADSTPTGVLVVNGSDTAVTVTLANPATGRYTGSCSLAGRSVGDDCWVRVTATVGGVTQEGALPGFRVAFSAALTNGLPVKDADGTVGANVLRWKDLAVPDTNNDGVPLVDLSALDGNTVQLAALTTILDYWTANGRLPQVASVFTAVALTPAYDAAKTAAQPGDAMALVTGAITLSKFGTGVLPANFASLSISAAGLVSADVSKWATVTVAVSATTQRPIVDVGSVKDSSTAATDLATYASSMQYLYKLNVAGTLAHTGNADTFKADVSGLLSTTHFDAGADTLAEAIGDVGTAVAAVPTAQDNAAALLATPNGAATVAAQLAHLDADVSGVSGGGSGGTLSDEQDAKLNSIYTATGQLTLGVRPVVTPVQPGSITLVQGDSYLNADGNPILVARAANAPWPTDLTGWTVTLGIEPTDATLADPDSEDAQPLTVTGAVVTATGDDQAVRFDLTAAQTAALPVPSGGGAAAYRYSVRVGSGSRRVTIERGTVTILEDATA